MKNNSPILVTGASGFVAIHTIIQLLEKGYKVRGTLRSIAREEQTRATVDKYISTDNLEFIVADLDNESNWEKAMQGCEHVLHIASPFPLFEPKDENELITPAVEGTLRILRMAHAANIKRVVQVSSNAAISAGHDGENKVFDESDWSKIENKIGAYSKSKTLAERAAWEFINGRENTNKMELVTINPPLILGPVPNKDFRTSIELVRTLMLGQVPGVARIKMGLVDVRDIASAIILAMSTPEAAGNRFLCSGGTVWVKDVADLLKKTYSARGYKINTLLFPSSLVRIMALFDKKIALVVKSVDWDYHLSSEKAKRVLNWSPRSTDEAILSMAESLIEQGLI
jgi:nucleoside-diphosphate-sugar epimerase